MFAMGPAFFGSAAGGYATLAITGSFAAATVGTAYSSSIPISGGAEPYALTGGTGIASGSLDSGFALSITGSTGAYFLTLACTSPATADTMSFTASVGSTDAQTAASAQSVVVSAATATAYQYWRIYVTTNNGDAYTAIGCGQFYVGATLQTMYDSRESSAFSGQPATQALEGTTGITNATFAWVSGTGASLPQWISAQISGGTTAAVNKLVMYCQASDLVARAPQDFLVQGSNDNATWTTIHTETGVIGWVSGTAKTFTW